MTHNTINQNTLDAYIKEATTCTDLNDHTGAILAIAEYSQQKHPQVLWISKQVKEVEAIRTLQEFYGHVPSELKTIREHVLSSIFSLLSEEEANQFKAVL